jgi:hypothetical protein
MFMALSSSYPIQARRNSACIGHSVAFYLFMPSALRAAVAGFIYVIFLAHCGNLSPGFDLEIGPNQ